VNCKKKFTADIFDKPEQLHELYSRNYSRNYLTSRYNYMNCTAGIIQYLVQQDLRKIFITKAITASKQRNYSTKSIIISAENTSTNHAERTNRATLNDGQIGWTFPPPIRLMSRVARLELDYKIMKYRVYTRKQITNITAHIYPYAVTTSRRCCSSPGLWKPHSSTEIC